MLGFAIGKTNEKTIAYANRKLSKLSIFIVCISLCVFLIFAVYYSAYKSMIIATSLFAFLCAFQAALRLIACLVPKPKEPDITVPDIWPFYTVLVPLFKEAHMAEQLMEGLGRLDYPISRLEIMMICEEVDPLTIAMVEKFLRPPFKLIIVPKGRPQTKPRALNYAVRKAKGEIITIYDAEDIPHSQQLKAAIKAFKDDPNIGALQAPLDYMNADENWITRQFALEYSALFHVWLPFLISAKLPIPLGGTSNHIRREALDAVGGWDAFNVTEDADLSFRLAAQAWGFGYINYATNEEAVNSWRAWHFQRVRWMKGFMRTWLVHMGVPFTPSGLTGIKRFFVLQLTIGLTLLNGFFHLPILVIIGGIIWTQMRNGYSIYIPFPFIISLAFSYGVGMLIGAVGAIRSGRLKLLFSILAMPFYWLALFIPTLHALMELGIKPFHWHKTHHDVKGPRGVPRSKDTAFNYDAFG